MANLLLPAAGRALVQRNEEFSFNIMRALEGPGGGGYDFEGIPQYLFDHKGAADCSQGYPSDHQQRPHQHQMAHLQPPHQHQMSHLQPPHQHQMVHIQPPHQQHNLAWPHGQQQHCQQPHIQQQQQQYQQQQQQYQRMPNQGQMGPNNKWPFPHCEAQMVGGVAAPPPVSTPNEEPTRPRWCDYKNKQGQHQQQPAPSFGPKHAQKNPGALKTGDQKRPTIPMSNCQALCCDGNPCSCQAPEAALWGMTPFDVSTCAWKQGRETAKMRVPDPQVVRPLDKSLPRSTRPTGHPYFNHGPPICPPHEAPIARGSGFNFQKWLATTQDREPPEHLRDKCISSLCTLCGPVTVECCPGYQIPQNYMLAKKV